MPHATPWRTVGLLTLVLCLGQPAAAQSVTAGPTTSLARAGVTTHPYAPTAQRSIEPSIADSGEAASDRGTHALVGGAIGAAAGLVAGTIVDYELNRKPSGQQLYTVHLGGFLLPPLGAIIGAIVGWHY